MVKKKIILESSYGEFGSEPHFTLSSAYVDEVTNDENYVYILTSKEMQMLKMAYEERNNDDNWLLSLFRNKKFPGHQKINDFIDNVVAKIKVLGEGGKLWKKFFKLVLVSSNVNHSIFKVALGLDDKIEEHELPLPKEYFNKLYLGLCQKMPKIIYHYRKSTTR